VEYEYASYHVGSRFFLRMLDKGGSDEHDITPSHKLLVSGFITQASAVQGVSV
jgi:hypothetical protein